MNDERIFPIMLITVPAMALAFLVSIWAMAAYAGGGHTAGLGVGAMGAVWGGPGFGLMAANVVNEFRNEHP